jgi:hypothetical protein
MNKNMIICMTLLGLGQLLVWFQLNGQFVWKWFDKNPLLLTLMGVPISYVFIIVTYYFMGEGITTKTVISLILSLTLVLIQIFWK